MKNRKIIGSSIFYILAATMVFTSVISFALALTWIKKPFSGFLTYKFPYVGSMGNPAWPGYQAGFRYLDRIVAVDGREIWTGNELVDLISNKPQGTIVYFLAESWGLKLQPSIPVSFFSLNDFIQVFMVPFVCGAIIFCLGVVVFLMKPHTKTSWVFFILCFSLGFYVTTGFEMQSTYYLVHVHYLTIPLMAAGLMHLGLIFPSKKPWVVRFPILEYLIYLPAFILILIYQVYLFTFQETLKTGFLSWFPNYYQITVINRIFSIFCLAGIILLTLYSYLKASTHIEKRRAGMILLGVIVAFFPFAFVTLLAVIIKYHLPWNYLTFFLIFFPASIAYSIVRHNLFDADALIKQTLGYAIMTVILIGTYALISLGLNFFLGQYQVAQSRAFPVVFTMLFILIFNPLRDHIQSIVDRLFFRKDYDAKQIIERLGAVMTSLMDLPQILRQLVRTFSEDMFIDNSAILLLNASGTAYQVRLTEGEKRLGMEGISFQKTEPLPMIIEKEKKEITKYDVLEDPKYKEICLDCAQNFSTLYASLIVPMVLRGEVIGFLSLGDKKSGKFYNREDIDLLRTLSTQGAVAIENARMAEQMKNEELVRANLARYLSPQIVDQIITKDVQVNLGGARKEVTVLFSDIRNFTSISESMQPEQLVEFLNEYFTEMARIIFGHQGSLDKYIGDAIVAVFGSLIPLENSAEAAVTASIEMMREMVRLNEKWKERYGFNMEMGIGVNTGEVFLGNIGSPERMEFTVIGDTVNTASRFSGLAKGRQILATRSTRERLGPGMLINKMPAAKVKGKAEEVEVFEISYEQMDGIG